MDQTQLIEQITQIKIKYEHQLLNLANVVGVGVGLKHKNGQPTSEIALVVNVAQKKPAADLDHQDIIPPELEGIPLDVQEVGTFKAL